MCVFVLLVLFLYGHFFVSIMHAAIHLTKPQFHYGNLGSRELETLLVASDHLYLGDSFRVSRVCTGC